jgi:diguanylate cyclase (GGDEF)-like protein/hemerythrin-like metal-binding protein/PAS domain S-box-containing protein
MHSKKPQTTFDVKSNNSIKNAETVLRTLDPGIWQWYIQTGELTLNSRWADIIGYTLDELQPISIKTWEEFSHPDDLKKSGGLLEAYFEGHTEFYEMEARMKHKDGSWVWVLDRGQVVEWDDQGKPVLMVGSHINITDHKRLEEIRSDEQYNNLIENAPFPILLIDAATRNLVYGNKRALVQFDLLGETLFFSEDFYVNKEDRKTFHEQMQRNGHIYDFEVELYNMSHQKFWALVSASFTKYKGSLTMILSINDITSRKNMENALAKEQNRMSLITTMMGDVIWVYNVSTDRYTYVSPSVENLRGYTSEEMMNQSIRQVIKPDSLLNLMNGLEERIAKFMSDPINSPNYNHEVEQTCKDGSTIWVEMSSRYRLTEDGQLEVVGSSRNIDERRKSEARIEYLNEHDSITGLRNRASFRKYEQTKNRMNPDQPISLLFIDFDHFGSINDNFGHRLGDKIIELIAHEIEKKIDTRGELYHFDGDEFVVVLNTVDPLEVEQISTQLNQYIAEPFMLENRLISVSVSIGYDIGVPGQLMESLLNNASTALYVAKSTRNCSKAYDESMAKAQTREIRLERDLSDAIDKKQLELYFQPIYNVKTGQVTDAEALLRWNHPEYGMVSPLEFIPIAERTRLIIPITDWVIQRALQVLAQWDIINNPPLVISVNVSFVSLANRGEELYHFLRQELMNSGVSAHRLKLEVTESSLVQDAAEVIKVFIRLKELGIKVALDDFGTGYSSFAYLKALPLDIVKIDRLLVRTLEWDQKSRIIIESMITIIHALGLEVIIEGVETLAQFELLRSMKADKIQGYLFSRPINIVAFRAYYLIAMKSESLPVKPFNDDWTEIRMHWHHDWDSGEPTIDQQHHDLMRFTADLERLSLLDNPNPEIIRSALSTLLTAVQTHFTDEENILERLHYDGLQEHKQDHESLLKRASDFVKQYEDGEIDLYVFVPFLVREVVWDHLLKEDVKYFHLFGTEINERSWRQFETIASSDEHTSRLQLHENAGLQALLSTISARLINVDSNDVDNKINQILQLCGNFFDVDRVYVFKYDWQAKTISNTYEWCHEGIEPQIDQLQDAPMELYDDWINAHIQGETIIVDKVTDLDPSSGLRQALEPQGIISLVTVPLIADNVCSGFLGFDSVRRKHTYSHLERAMLSELSNLLLVTIKRKAVDEQLAREREFYELTVSALDAGFILVDKNRRITFINPVAERLIGKSLTELKGLDIRNALELYDMTTMTLMPFDEEQMSIPGFSMDFPDNIGFLDKNGQSVYVSGRVSRLLTPSNDEVFLINFQDITSEYAAKQQIDAFLNVNLDLLCVSDLKGNFIKVNHRFTEILGYTTEELMGRTYLDLVHPDDVQPTLNLLQTASETKRIDGFINRYRTSDGRYISIEWTADLGFGKYLYAAGRDVTDRLKIQTSHEYNAFHDSMTGLYNRRYLEEVFKTLGQDRRSHPITIILADMDGLKEANDTLGHESGDQMIMTAAKRLSEGCRPSDVVGRWGGDEFLIILPKTNEEEGKKIAERCLNDTKLEKTNSVAFVLSFGIATKKSVDDQVSDVMRLADERMYMMKIDHHQNIQ